MSNLREILADIFKLSTTAKLAMASQLVATRPDLALKIAEMAPHELKLLELDAKFEKLKQEGKL